MTDRDDHAARLRDRAARLFAMALRAREDGNDQYAEELTLLASEAIDQATDLESAGCAGDASRRAADPTAAVGPRSQEKSDKEVAEAWRAKVVPDRGQPPHAGFFQFRAPDASMSEISL